MTSPWKSPLELIIQERYCTVFYINFASPKMYKNCNYGKHEHYKYEKYILQLDTYEHLSWWKRLPAFYIEKLSVSLWYAIKPH